MTGEFFMAFQLFESFNSFEFESLFCLNKKNDSNLDSYGWMEFFTSSREINLRNIFNRGKCNIDLKILIQIIEII